MNTTKPFMLVDAYSQIFRMFYAVRALSSSTGEPSNAVFAMTKFLLKLYDEYPDFDGAFVFDLGRPPHRLALAPLYKANRPPMPEALKQQMETIRSLITAFGWPVIQQQDWEADDLIACISKKFSQTKIMIVSSDKDLAQLVNDRVLMLVPDQTGKGFSVRGPEQVFEKFGVSPQQIPDYLAIIGDSVDNIPGVNGAGPKTAAQLISQCGSIHNMLEHPEKIIREKLRTKILDSKDLLQKNMQLIQLVQDPPAEAVWTEETFHRKMPDFEAVFQIAQHYELKSLLGNLKRRLETSSEKRFRLSSEPYAKSSASVENSQKSASMEQMNLF